MEKHVKDLSSDFTYNIHRFVISSSLLGVLKLFWGFCTCQKVTFIIYFNHYVIYHSGSGNPVSKVPGCFSKGLYGFIKFRRKSTTAMQETWVWALGREDPLKKGMATHSSIFAWRISWSEEPGGSQKVRHDWATNTHKVHLGSLKFSGLIWFYVHCQKWHSSQNHGNTTRISNYALSQEKQILIKLMQIIILSWK